MLLSIYVTQYNNEKYLPNLLKSIENNPLDDGNYIELVIVDDCSKKSCEDIVSEFKMNNTNKSIIDVKFIRHSENKGTLITRKTGVLNCSGDYILGVDGDDELLPNSLKPIISELKMYNPDVYEGRCKETFIIDKRAYECDDNKTVLNNLIRLKSDLENHIDKYTVKQGLTESTTNLLEYEYCVKNIIVWSKIIKRDIYIKSMNLIKDIPNAINTEDTYIVFSILLNAKTYYGSTLYFYKYNLNYDGICSNFLNIKNKRDVSVSIYSMYRHICDIVMDMLKLKTISNLAFNNVRRQILTRFINTSRSMYLAEQKCDKPNIYIINCDLYGKDLWDKIISLENELVNSYYSPYKLCDDFGFDDISDNPIHFYEYDANNINIGEPLC